MDSPYSEPERHGGDVAAAARTFGRPAAGWLDLSTGINPNPYPHLDVSDDALARLPDAEALSDLLAAARAYYGVPDGAEITAAPGTQSLIQILPGLIAGSRVAIAGPTYSEHAIAWTRAGRHVDSCADAAALARADIAVVVTPNNPDGRIHAPEALGALSGVVVADEAFADVAPEVSAVALTAEAEVVVLRSFGKFFGLAGLRLGFCISRPGFAARLREALGPWAVSGPALEIGTRALRDSAWIAATRARLAAGRARLDATLGAAGLRVVGGTDLFRLVETPGAAALYRHLGAAGILVRRFAEHPDWLRFGLPGDEAGFDRLATALDSYAASSR